MLFLQEKSEGILVQKGIFLLNKSGRLDLQFQVDFIPFHRLSLDYM